MRETEINVSVSGSKPGPFPAWWLVQFASRHRAVWLCVGGKPAVSSAHSTRIPRPTSQSCLHWRRSRHHLAVHVYDTVHGPSTCNSVTFSHSHKHAHGWVLSRWQHLVESVHQSEHTSPSSLSCQNAYTQCHSPEGSIQSASTLRPRLFNQPFLDVHASWIMSAKTELWLSWCTFFALLWHFLSPIEQTGPIADCSHWSGEQGPEMYQVLCLQVQVPSSTTCLTGPHRFMDSTLPQYFVDTHRRASLNDRK